MLMQYFIISFTYCISPKLHHRIVGACQYWAGTLNDAACNMKRVLCFTHSSGDTIRWALM